MNQTKIHISQDEFIASNMKYSNLDIECEFISYGKRGIQGTLWKLSKTNKVPFLDALYILLGKLACVGEEWNFKELKKENWEYIFNPNDEHANYILKEFKKCQIGKFEKRFSDYLNFIEDQTKELTISTTFTFNGKNNEEIYKSKYALPQEKVEKLNPLVDKRYLNCYANTELWHWQFWFVETEDEFYLYEESILT